MTHYIHHQSGFRRYHSCESGLASLLSESHKYIDNNHMVGCINIDLRKAFDLINFDILYKKHECYKCNNKSIAWFHSYFQNRKQSVYIDGCTSKKFNICHGVPQGSILGSLLFILFINDLPLCLNNSSIDMNADDTSLYVIGTESRSYSTIKMVQIQ